MARTEDLLVLPEEDGQRLDKFLSERLEELTRTAAEKLAVSGEVCKSGVALPKSYKVRAGDCIAVTIPDPVEAEVLPEAIPLDIVYEDADLLARGVGGGGGGGGGRGGGGGGAWWCIRLSEILPARS